MRGSPVTNKILFFSDKPWWGPSIRFFWLSYQNVRCFPVCTPARLSVGEMLPLGQNWTTKMLFGCWFEPKVVASRNRSSSQDQLAYFRSKFCWLASLVQEANCQRLCWEQMNTNNIHTYALHGLGLQEQDECRVGGFTGNCLGSRATVYQLTAIDKNMFFFRWPNSFS